MLAAGTGIAPMLQVIQGILANEDDETLIHLVYSSQRYADILMKDTLDEMKAFWNFSVLYIVTKVSEFSLSFPGSAIVYLYPNNTVSPAPITISKCKYSPELVFADFIEGTGQVVIEDSNFIGTKCG